MMRMLGRRERAKREAVSNVDGPWIPPRGGIRRGAVAVNEESAMRTSAVWACLQLRAGLISTFPLDVFRKVGGYQVEMPKAPIFNAPGGGDWTYLQWMHASQVDLDRAGNCFGLITERNALGLPARIELQPISHCAVVQNKGSAELKYRIDGKTYPVDQVWHERQYVVAGLPVGLSPIGYAAWALGEYLSMQEFALGWFGNGGGVPKAKLKNTEKSVVDAKEAGILRDRWAATIANGELFVHGKAWEYDMVQAQTAGVEWLDGRRFGLSEISRFFGCPADLIDAAISAPGSITYASMTQRNLQFLIMQLGPAINRREEKLSTLLPTPRFVKLNTDALLRMDPETRSKVLNQMIEFRRLTVTEARELDNRPPLTPEQEAEFVRLFGDPRSKVPIAGPSRGRSDPAALGAGGPIRVPAMVGTSALAIEASPWEGAT